MYIWRGYITIPPATINGQMIVIAPTDIGFEKLIYVAWQTNSANEFYVSMIDRLETTESGLAFKVQLGDEHTHTFSATVSDTDNSLFVSMHGSEGESVTTLTRVYDGPVNYLPALRIYVGYMNYSIYAVQKMFMIVAPDCLATQTQLLTYWQWTVTDTGEKNENCDVTYTISSAEGTEKGEQICFGHGFYSFVANVDEDDQTMVVTMTDGNGAATSAMVLRLMNPEPPASRRPKRAIHIKGISFDNHTSTIKNGSSHVVFCTLRNSSSAALDTQLAFLGLALAVTAAVVAPPVAGAVIGIKVATNIGYTMSVASLPAASAGVAQVTVGNSNSMRSALLFPGDVMVRASWGPFGSNNDVTITYLAIATVIAANNKKQHLLTLYNATRESIGNNTLNVSELIGTPEVVKGLEIELPEGASMTSVRFLTINSLKFVGQPNPNRIPQLNSLNPESFVYDAASSVVVLQGTNQNARYEVLHIPGGESVLKIKDCKLDGQCNKRNLGVIMNWPNKVPDYIAENRSPTYWAYEYMPSSSRLFVVSGGQNVVVAESPRHCVYFPIKEATVARKINIGNQG